MSTRSVLGLIYMVQGLQQLGEDPLPVLARHGLRPEQLDPSTRIERGLELRIYADMAKNLRDPLVGLKLGGFYGLAGYGPLVMLLMTCGTVYEALQTGIRYQRLTYLYGSLRFEPGEQLSALVLSPLPMAPHAFRFRADGEISGTYKLIRDLQQTLGLDLHAERIEMPYSRPPEASAYESHFGCPVRFGEAEARFWMRNEHLQLRLPTADPNAQAMYRAMCEQQLLAQETSAETVSDRVLAHLSLVGGDYPGAQDVARALDMSERTLRRQLQAEGQSFRALLARARYDKARHLLHSSAQSVESIAQQLGYAEPAAFNHAFQRWSGMTPSAFRAAPPASSP